MKVKETRKLYGEDLRRLCIKNNWYTNGNSEQYGQLLNFADGKGNVTAPDIVAIAEDIKRHSANVATGEQLEYICFEVAAICHSFFEITA